MAEEGVSNSLEYTPTWVVAVVCFIIVLISLCAERSLHKLGKFLYRERQDALYEALEKLKEELMLLGFISLLLTVFQNLISKICIPAHISYDMLPCKKESPANVHHGRRLLSAEADASHCEPGQVQLLSLEALHHLHIFIFVLAVVHVVFCVTTVVLGGASIRKWKHWEDAVNEDYKKSKTSKSTFERKHALIHLEFFKKRAQGYWRKAAVVSWMMAFFKQFYGSVTRSDYIALRQGFIKEHFPRYPLFNFHKYMLRTLEVDFKKIVGISWYLWLFVVLFLLLNLDGWHTYFWLSFLPLILLLLVGAKLEHIIIRLAQENAVKKPVDQEAQHHEGRKKADETGTPRVKPSDEYFWFGKPSIVLILIHFILFQNSFEIAFFFWILCTYGFHSCIMEKVGYIIPRLFIGVIVQVLCSYSTLPLYAIVTQMGSNYKEGIFRQESAIRRWAGHAKRKGETGEGSSSASKGTEMRKMDRELSEIVQVTEQSEILHVAEQASVADDGETASKANLNPETKLKSSASKGTEMRKMDTELSEIVQVTEQAEILHVAEQASVADEGETASKANLNPETKLPSSTS